MRWFKYVFWIVMLSLAVYSLWLHGGGGLFRR